MSLTNVNLVLANEYLEATQKDIDALSLKRDYGYTNSPTPHGAWKFSGDPAITGGKSWCDFTVNVDGSVTCKPRGPYANLYFWIEYPALPGINVWTTGYAVLVSDYGPVQAVEYDGQFQQPDWIYNFGLQLDKNGTKQARFFQYGNPGHWVGFGQVNANDFKQSQPVSLSAGFEVDQVAKLVTLLGVSTSNTEYKPRQVHAAFNKPGTTAKWTKGGQVDFDGSGKGATVTIQQHHVMVL